MVCVECQAPSTYWLCSDACYLTYVARAKREDRRPCATHDNTNAVTRICRLCRRHDVANKGWTSTPSRERNAVELDETQHISVGFDVQHKPEPFSNALCIEIVRLWLLDTSQTAIAAEVGCTQPYVFKVVSYWKRKRLNTLSVLSNRKRSSG
jgi:hypothetical protein